MEKDVSLRGKYVEKGKSVATKRRIFFIFQRTIQTTLVYLDPADISYTNGLYPQLNNISIKVLAYLKNPSVLI